MLYCSSVKNTKKHPFYELHSCLIYTFKKKCEDDVYLTHMEQDGWFS